MMQWYYAEGGKQVGPVSDADFQELLKSGRIVPKTLVWRAGMANWAAYETLYPAQPQPDAAVVPQEPDSGGNGNTLNPDLMAHARQALASR